MTSFRTLLFFGILLAATTVPGVCRASVAVSPLLIDKTVAGRDMLEETITLTNDGSTPMRLFATVNEITMGEGSTIKAFLPPSMSNTSVSITSWIAIQRGRIELAPGESKTIPVKFQVSPSVLPGVYQAFIGFAHGSKRDEAEALVMSGQGNGVVVRLNIEKDTSEILRLLKFTVDRFITTAREHSLTYAVSNPGDVPMIPVGEVIIYNTRGEEVGTVPLNPDKTTVDPGATVEFSAPIESAGLFGRYKAFLQLDYGNTQRATLYDTAFFYATPLWALGALFASILVVVGFILYLLRRSFVDHEFDNEVGHVRMSINQGAISDNKDHDISLKKNTTE